MSSRNRATPRPTRTTLGTAPPGGSGARWLAVALAAAAGIYLCHAYAFRDFVIDDAFISFRYARHLASGLGPVFNPGQRVEGFSNPSFVGVLALLAPALPGADGLPLAGRLLGVLSALGCLVLLARLGYAGGPAAAILAMLYTATSTGFALWSVAGLETVPYALVVLAAVALHASPPRRAPGQVGQGLLLAAIALSRPEGALIAGTLFVLRLADRGVRYAAADTVRVALSAALPVAVYLAFRQSYYGEWLPNPYYAKHIPLAMAPGLAARYLWGFVTAHGGPLLYLPALAAVLPRACSRVAAAALAVLAAQVAFIVLVGGDWMHQHRFLVPVIPLLGVLIAEGLARLAREAAGRLNLARGGRAALALALALVPGLFLVPHAWTEARRERASYWVNSRPYYETVGRLVRELADPAWTVATDDIGAIGWYGDIQVLDLLGLTDPAIARRRTWAEARLAELAPELVVLHYDDRLPARGRWRVPRILHFDSVWVVPRAGLPLPGSLRVRRDVLEAVEGRLARVPEPLRASLVRLDAYLRAHQPDGLPLSAPPGR